MIIGRHAARTIALTCFSGTLMLGTTAGHRPGGATHEVKMVGGTDFARFEPATVEAQPGDEIAFVVVSGPPHNVSFDSTAVTGSVKEKLRAAVHDPMLPFSSSLLVKAGDRYVVSLAGLSAGRYPFYCLAHLALHMNGVLVVK